MRLTLRRYPLEPARGIGVHAAVAIEPHAFVLEYAGALLSAAEAVAVEAKYAALQPAVGSYMYWIAFPAASAKGRSLFCIDATRPGPDCAAGSR